MESATPTTEGGAPSAMSSSGSVTIPNPVHFDGVPTVGALFFTTGTKSHFCTASVVDSSRGDIISSQDPNLDFAFLTVAPQIRHRHRVPVQRVTSTEFDATQMQFYCNDFQDGTSGGPWILLNGLWSFAWLPLVSFLDTTPGDKAEVLLAVERVVVGSRPGRDRAAGRLVAVEG